MSPRDYSLAYLTSRRCDPVQALQVAAATGYQSVGLRLWPNAPGAPQQHLLGHPEVLRETLAAQRDTGVQVFDLEIVRLDEHFEIQGGASQWQALFEAAAALKAKAILVAGDDTEPQRLSQHYGQLCAALKPYGLSANLEFMPWTAVPDARAALRVVAQAGSPENAGILIDALHFGRSNTTLDDIRAIPRQLLHYAQLCDAQAGQHFSTEQMIHTARCERCLPGQGSIDLKGLVAALPADLPLSVEIVNFELEATTPPLEWAATCLKATQALVTTAL